MNLIKPLVVATVVGLTSCATIKELPHTNIKTIDGVELVENSAEKISIQYNGDYWFHTLSKGLTLNWNQAYITSFKTYKPRIVYCAHTTEDAYYTSVALAYNKVKGEDIISLVSSDLKKRFLLENYHTEKISGMEITRVSYNLPNKKLKITTQHTEYFFESKSKVIRIIFWTLDGNNDGSNKEPEDMIRTLKMGM